jgi:hypothetical protein
MCSIESQDLGSYAFQKYVNYILPCHIVIIGMLFLQNYLHFVH